MTKLYTYRCCESSEYAPYANDHACWLCGAIVPPTEPITYASIDDVRAAGIPLGGVTI